MNDFGSAERTIDLKDMVFWTMKQWRIIICGALVIALLAGIFQVFEGLSVLLDDEKLADAKDKYEIVLHDFEATGERLKTRIVNLREQSANQQEYNRKSVLMLIDPMEKWVGNFQIYIDSKYQIDPNLTYQNIDPTNRLISAYSNYLRSGEFYKELVADTDRIDEIRFLTEVYSVTSDPSTATVSVSCMGVTEAEVQQMLDFVKVKFAEQFETLSNAIGEHSYEILTESVYSTIDLGLDAAQKNNLLAIADYSNAIGETNDELSDWEKLSVPKPEYGIWYTIKQTIKFIIVGGVIGVVLLLVWFIIKYIMSGFIKTDEDIKGFRLPVFGYLDRERYKKRFMPVIDKWIDKMFGRVRTTTLEQSYTLAARNLGAVLKERGSAEVSMVGRLPDGLAEELAKKLDAVDTNISIRYVGDVLTDSTAVDNLGQCNEVLILVDRYTTRYADIEQVMTLLNAWGKAAIGALVVDP